MKTKYLYLPFNQGKAELEREGFEIPSTWRNTELRIKEGYKSNISTNGNWVKEGPLYLKGDNTRLLPIGLPFKNPIGATNAHRNGGEYTSLNAQEVEQARAEGLEVNPKDLNEKGNIVIPTRRFGSDKYGIWSFGGEGTDEEKSKRAQNYGDWLLNSPFKIESINVYLDNANYTEGVGDHANQFWLCGVVGVGRSGLVGGSRGRDYYDRVLGVKESGEATAPKLYSPKHLKILRKVLNKEGIIGDLEKRIISNVDI